VLVGVPVAWGIVMTIAQASELALSWRLALTLLPLVLGVVVTVGFHFLDKSRFTVRGVVGPYFTAVALLFGLYASLMATEVWQRSARSTALMRTEIAELDSALRIAEGVQPRDRTVRRAVEAELASISAGDLRPTLGVAEAPLQKFYVIAADGSFFAGAPSANAAFYRAIEEIHAAKLERDALEGTRLGPSKLFTLLVFGLLTQIAVAICHAGNVRALGAAVMLFSVAFAASIGILELMDDRIPVVNTPAAIAEQPPH
jgi:hypothetical protein